MTKLTTLIEGHNDPKGRFGKSICDFARPANATAYTALDIIADQDSVDTAVNVMEFPEAGRSGSIIGASIVIGQTATIVPRLFIFDGEPTNQEDNVSIALVAADAAKLVGILEFAEADKVLVDGILNHYVPTAAGLAALAAKIPYTSATGRLYGLLQTVPGYTPSSACTFHVRLQFDRGGVR